MLSITTIPQPVTERPPVGITRETYSQLSAFEQMALAFAPGRRCGALLGAAIGGIIPVGSYEVIHYETISNQWMWIFVCGLLAFSAMSVWRWTALAMDSGWKALGFCLGCEGLMVFSRCHWLSLAMLAVLITINAAAASFTVHIRPESTATNGTGIQSLGLQKPAVTVNVVQANQNVTTGRQSRTDAQRREGNARRSREYRARKRHEMASQTVTPEDK